PERLARYGLTVTYVVNALRQANASISAGDVEEGKRRYVVRAEGEFSNVDQVLDAVLRSDQSADSGRIGRVTMRDIGSVRLANKEPTARIRYLGQPAIAINVQRETGANVIETMAGVRVAVAELNERFLDDQQLILTQVYDETTYIDSAIDLVQSNIMVGGSLAAIVLLVFLRSIRATAIVSLAIPVSVIGSFVAMAALGRSINVISLAGMAFAVGMVVDAAIVVLENIYRLRQSGVPARRAALEGADQVWAAVLVSVLTTVMAFIPILMRDLEVAQLFRDIAVAISVSVILSLIVATTVIPSLSSRLLAQVSNSPDAHPMRLPLIDDLGRAVSKAILGFARLVTRRRAVALLIVIAITGSASFATWHFLPKLEYLPEGNQNFVFGVILPPPGYNLATNTEIARQLEDDVRPMWAIETGPERGPGEPPKISNFFFVTFQGQTFVGASAVDENNAGELIPHLQGPIFKEPGTFGFMSQPSIFGRGIGGGRSIELDIGGPDLETVLGVALKATGLIGQALPQSAGNQFRPIPGLELGAPEVRVTPDRIRLADAGVTARELGDTIDAFNDGLRVAEITVDGKRIDLTLKGPNAKVTSTQGIASLPVVTQRGTILPVNALADVDVVAGPTEVRHKERLRTVTLEIRPSPAIALEQALEVLRTEVIEPIEADGLPGDVQIALTGTADELSKTWSAMVVDLALAVAIVYLVMAVLFSSFWYPLIILVAVPVAAAGGVAGLGLLNLYVAQPLDMLTMLGFIILVGIVVNNAILLVDLSLRNLRIHGLDVETAIVEATRNRIRPIFMSTLTSLFGMTPLILFPGAGSELYRGIGAVVIGGLALSTLVALILIPPLLSMFMGLIEGGKGRRADVTAEAQPGAAAE
ncbi:MAG: efflux RND transporter permease subunit, partial [Rhizobiales bacterium]|nr:efflux RND transporter permease subunit [Hyphomicrobiales bacterium]